MSTTSSYGALEVFSNEQELAGKAYQFRIESGKGALRFHYYDHGNGDRMLKFCRYRVLLPSSSTAITVYQRY